MKLSTSRVPPSIQSIEGGPVEIESKDASIPVELQRWIHDQDYDLRDIEYSESERLLEVPFLCTVYHHPGEQWGTPLFAKWWVPVVRGYLRLHNVRDYEIEDQGYAQIHDLQASRFDDAGRPRGFEISGISTVSGRMDDFEVSLEILDRIIAWRRMTWVLFVESEGHLQFYDEACDDLAQRRLQSP